MPVMSPLKHLLTNYDSFFKMDYIGKIRDPLHDTIPFTDVEKIIIDRPEFQRLRRIHQTAFIHYVFPGATHTRFEHSLGVMHISGLLYSALIANQRRILTSLEQAFAVTSDACKLDFAYHEKKVGSLFDTRAGLEYLEKSSYLAQCLRFAALLHDCGHGPLSHSGERFMPSWEFLRQKLDTLEIPEWLKGALQAKMSNSNNLSTLINHEIYTLFIIVKMFKYDNEFLSGKMGRDICAVLNTSIAPYPGGDLEKSGMQTLFHEVVSGEIDVDRMDYLLRDSHECGVVYGYFDLGRILDSLGFYLNKTTNQYHLALRRSGISAYEDYLRARLSMYNQVYFHKTATACEAMLEYLRNKSSHFNFPLDIDLYINLDDYSLFEFFNKKIPKENNENLAKFLRELLQERKLWKRVYEESVPFHVLKNSPSLCPAILNFLKEQNIPAELIETSTNLTRFSPKGKGGISKNNFKVIIKNVNSLRFLEPIENHSNLINRIDEELMVRRIFIAQYDENHVEIDTNFIQKIISEKIINSDRNEN